MFLFENLLVGVLNVFGEVRHIKHALVLVGNCLVLLLHQNGHFLVVRISLWLFTFVQHVELLLLKLDSAGLEVRKVDLDGVLPLVFLLHFELADLLERLGPEHVDLEHLVGHVERLGHLDGIALGRR